jgi:hypothetical protein
MIRTVGKPDNRDTGVPKLFQRQVRELFMATESRAARKAIKANPQYLKLMNIYL